MKPKNSNASPTDEILDEIELTSVRPAPAKEPPPPPIEPDDGEIPILASPLPPDRRLRTRFRSFSDQKHAQRARGKSHRRALTVFGMFTALFTVIGLIASISAGVGYTRDLISQKALKADLERELVPFVIMDVPEFSDPTKLDPAVTSGIAVWRLLMQSDLSQYEKDDYGNIFVPDSDIARYVHDLFGEGVRSEHQTNPNTASYVTYEVQNHEYTIQTQPQYVMYTPHITQLQKTDEGYILTVQYVLADPLSRLRGDNRQTLVKTMRYHVRQLEDDGYRVSQVKLVSIDSDSYIQP